MCPTSSCAKGGRKEEAFRLSLQSIAPSLRQFTATAACRWTSFCAKRNKCFVLLKCFVLFVLLKMCFRSWQSKEENNQYMPFLNGKSLFCKPALKTVANPSCTSILPRDCYSINPGLHLEPNILAGTFFSLGVSL